MKSDGRWQLDKILACTVAVILVLLPFHAFFSSWAASHFGHFDLIRIWKELLIAVLSLGAAWVLYKDKQLRRNLLKNRLVQLILIYVLFQLVAGLVALSLDKVNLNALLYGWI